MEMKLGLITYGCGESFQRVLFEPIKNREWIKPHGGLWSSPIDSELGWADWCKSNDYGNLSQSFEFEFEGNVFVIDSYDDALSAPILTCDVLDYKKHYIDFEKLIALGYDAVWLTECGEYETRNFNRPLSLYGWDCESVLIMNPDCILESCEVSA